MGENAIKKSTFFDFLNRYTDYDYDVFLEGATEDVDYINWHGYCLIAAYGDKSSEYNAVRNSCALFDASPIKKYKISGTDAGAFLDAVMTRQISRQKSMRVIYATLCNENGMLLDDGLLYKFTEDNYLLMISEINHDEHFAKASNGFGNLKIEEVTSSLSGLAVQGPKSCAVLNCMGFTSIENLEPFEIKDFYLGGGKIIVARVGFTADLGYELWFEPGLNKAVGRAIGGAEEVLGIQIAGYGLNALNALRLEGGFVVPGWETAQTFENDEYERTPFELGISWTVDLSREDNFIGKAALLKEKENGPRFKTIGLAIDKRCELEDGTELYSVIDGETWQTGTLPSVAWSYELNCCLSLASIRSEFSSPGIEYHVKIDDEQIVCRVVTLPFVKFSRYRDTPVVI
jgi:aminomethyltransferase